MNYCSGFQDNWRYKTDPCKKIFSEIEFFTLCESSAIKYRSLFYMLKRNYLKMYISSLSYERYTILVYMVPELEKNYLTVLFIDYKAMPMWKIFGHLAIGESLWLSEGHMYEIEFVKH